MLWFVALSVHNQWSVQLIYTQTKQECLLATQNILLEITEILVAVFEGSFILRDQNHYMIFQVSQCPDKYRWKKIICFFLLFYILHNLRSNPL